MAKMARRKVISEKNDNTHRWLVSYADFITLLFAVFVVMYAVTNVSLEKYKALLHLLDIPFEEVNELDPQDIEKHILKEISLEEQTMYLLEKIEDKESLEKLLELLEENLSGKFDVRNEDQSESSGGIANNNLGANLTAGTSQKRVEERKHEDWLQVELRSVFPSASAYPKDEAMPLLELIASILKKHKTPVSIGGYTDNIPIRTDTFPSNWELSASRAAAVVRVLEEFGVDSIRMTAVGYGDQYPVAGNDTADGRRKNRRIALMIALNEEMEKELVEELKPYTRRYLQRTNQLSQDAVIVNVKKLRLKPGDNRLPADFLKKRSPAADTAPANAEAERTGT